MSKKFSRREPKMGFCDCCYSPQGSQEKVEVFTSEYRHGDRVFTQDLCAKCRKAPPGYIPARGLKRKLIRWEILYPGAPDPQAGTGHAAASWHTFDRRVWKLVLDEAKDDYIILKLTNRKNSEGVRAPPKKIASYRVTAEDREGRLIVNVVSCDYTRLVRDVKRLIEGMYLA